MATGHDEAVPKDFHHPFTPYDIQVQFMTAVYDAIEDGCVGIFESPTGMFSLYEKDQNSAKSVQERYVNPEA